MRSLSQTLMLGILGISLLACGRDPAIGSPDDTPFITGSYSVPVDKELEAHAHYPNIRVRWRESSVGSARLTYRLPALLTGYDDSLIVLTGTVSRSAPFEMRSEHNDALCEISSGQVICKVHYRNLPINSAAVSELVTQQFKDQGSKIQEARLRVSREFEGDPVGIIVFPDIPAPL